MKNSTIIAVVCITSLVPGIVCAAAGRNTQEPPKTVAVLHPDLTSGALTFARADKLPEPVIMQAGDIRMTSGDIEKSINAQAEQVREEMKKNAFFLLEQQVTIKLVLGLARKVLASDPNIAEKDDGQIIQQYFEEHVFRNLKVTDAEAEKFFAENKDMFGTSTLQQVLEPLKQYLLEQKKSKIASENIRDLGKKIDIRISATWLKKHAALAKDNPIDKARGSGRPSLVDFGAEGCRPCDMLAPIIEEIKTEYAGRVNVVFVHTGQHQILASRYGVQAIPVQIFYDNTGKEVFRHVGFIPKDQIEGKLRGMGIK